jgi:hypothetical protein
MATVNLYIDTGGSELNKVSDVIIDYIDDKEVNKATFVVHESLDVRNGDEIKFFDDESVMQFRGKCKEINPLDGDSRGQIELICYTYEIELTERTVTQVFQNVVLETFIQNIVTTYSVLNFSTTLNTGITVEYYLADKKPAFDLVKDLIDRSPDITYYIDYVTNTFHLIKKGSIESASSLIQNGNALFSTGWKAISDKQVTVLNLTGGKEVRNGFTESFSGDGIESTFVLTNAPSNVKVVVDSVEQVLEVSGQNEGDFTIVVKDKQIIFKSGSIPASGTNNIEVTYDYEIPIDLSGIEAGPEVINQYGRIEKTITRDHIKSIADGLDYGYEYVNRWSLPLFGNDAQIIDSLDANQFIPGSKIFVEDTDHTINGETVSQYYLIKRVTYTFAGLVISVGEIRSSVMDFVKELKYEIGQLESSNINSSVISKTQILKNKSEIIFTTSIDSYQEREITSDALYYDVGREYDDNKIYDGGDDAGGWTDI